MEEKRNTLSATNGSMIHRRAGYRGVITKMEGEIDTFLSYASVTQVRAEIEALNHARSLILTLDAGIADTLTIESEIEKECIETIQVNRRIMNLAARLRDALTKLEATESSSNEAARNTDPVSSVRLPKLKLKLKS